MPVAPDEIAVHPEFERLFREVQTGREELSALLFERDELIFHVCKDIEADYMLKIGSLEYKAYEFECGILRIKRKIELVQAKLNRQEFVYLPAIEELLDAEYAEYTENLQARLNSINEALRRNEGGRLSAEDSVELKKLYRQALKKLHPDLNPNLPEERRRLFPKAILAYRSGDLNAVRTICLLLAEITPSVESSGDPDALEALRMERDMLRERGVALRESIEKIKNSFPYNRKAFLRDAQKVAERVRELDDLLAHYREVYAEYEQRLGEMLTDASGETGGDAPKSGEPRSPERYFVMPGEP
jgi:hypothetical protein